MGSVIVDQADVLSDHVVDLPLIADQMHFVIDRVLVALARKNLTADIGKSAVDTLVGVDDFFIGIGLDDAGIGAFEDFGKEPDELFLFLGCAPPPVRAPGPPTRWRG